MNKLTAGLLAAAWIALTPTAASADPPGPTDYRTTVVDIEPATTTIDLTIIGGDAFVQLTVDPGSHVEVAGYQAEPFLEFLANGDVIENQASITYHTSQTRYGSDIPDHITADTPPDWRTVSTDGSYAWHDHRTHWMNGFRPPGRQPGDVILEAALPLVVDGQPVTVHVQSVWEPAPSPIAAWFGAGIGLSLAVIVLTRRTSATTITTLAAVALVAATIGIWQYRSVPAATGPSRLSVLLPAAAVLLTVIALVAVRWRSAFTAYAAATVAAIEIIIWIWLRRAHVTAAILPTEAPWWLDRAATTAIALPALAAAAIGLQALIVPQR